MVHVQSYIQEERVMAHLTNWIGIDDHADKLTIALYVGPQKQPTKEWEVAPTEAGLRQLVRWIKEGRCIASTKLVRAGMNCTGSWWPGRSTASWPRRL